MTTLAKSPIPERPERLFTVQEYLRMVAAGILNKRDKVELIEGRIVKKMATDPPHVLVLEMVCDLLKKACDPGWIVRVDSPLTLEKSAPEPDAMVIRGPRELYRKQHPVASDVLLVVEVSDSTLREDRNEMAQLYGGARIPTYWIVNLQDRRLEVHTEPSGPSAAPTYRRKIDIEEEGTVALQFPGGTLVQFAVREMFPPQ